MLIRPGSLLAQEEELEWHRMHKHKIFSLPRHIFHLKDRLLHLQPIYSEDGIVHPQQLLLLLLRPHLLVLLGTVMLTQMLPGTLLGKAELLNLHSRQNLTIRTMATWEMEISNNLHSRQILSIRTMATWEMEIRKRNRNRNCNQLFRQNLVRCTNRPIPHSSSKRNLALTQIFLNHPHPRGGRMRRQVSMQVSQRIP